MMAIVKMPWNAVVAFSVLLAGCELRYVKAYSGSDLPREKLAAIVGDAQVSPLLLVPEEFPQTCYPLVNPIQFSCQVALRDFHRSNFQAREWIAITRIDAEDLSGLPARIRVLPGHHTISVAMRKREAAVSGVSPWFSELTSQTLEFNARAGRTYRIRFERATDHGGGSRSRVPLVQAEKVSNWIEDTETGEVVGGMKPAQ
jgi:hypothetical protein